MMFILFGLGLILVGLGIGRSNARALKKRPTSASDYPTMLGAAVIAGGVMMMPVSVAMLLISA
jgi:hypothetical protein